MTDSEHTVRVFFGLACPVLPSISALLEELRGSEAAREGHLRVVPQANLHLTLRYLGAVDSRRVGVLCDMVEGLLTRPGPFSYTLHSAGHFANALWIGADVPPRIHGLVDELDRRLREAGFGEDAMPFRPHVTVARLRRRCRTMAEELSRQLAGRAFGRVAVNSVTLYRSEPEKGMGGSHYRPIREFPL